MSFKIKGIILGGALVDSERQINHYDSFLESTGIVSQNRRNLTSLNINKAIINSRNSRLIDAQQLVEKVISKEASSTLYNGMSVFNYKRYSDDNTGADYVRYLNANKKQMGIPDNVSFVEENLAVKNGLASDFMVSYLKGIEVALKAETKVLIYNGQNDFLTPTAGVFTYLQNLEWPFAKDWRETPK